MEEELKFDVEATEENKEAISERNEEPKKKVKQEIFEWIKSLLIYCVLPLAIFWIFCFMATVPTGSMEKTIPTGAQVFNTRIFNKDNIERGDIIVFNSKELGVILIKRCIGLPGDHLLFDGTGALYINGELYPEPYVSTVSPFKGEFTVPEDCYFFCGDNRGASHDARHFNNPYIHKDDIMGKARFILFPLSNFGTLE